MKPMHIASSGIDPSSPLWLRRGSSDSNSLGLDDSLVLYGGFVGDDEKADSQECSDGPGMSTCSFEQVWLLFFLTSGISFVRLDYGA
jgi:hypothetical protein